MPKARLFISTDMQMITGVNHRDGDKDDVQSLIHALMYQDKVNIVGIASSTSKHQPGANDDRFIHLVIDEYAKDRGKLAAHADGYKTADELHDVVYQGTKSLAGDKGYPAATDASNAIIREARAAAEAGEKLYVATWGGLGDVARALHDAPEISGHVRLLSASGPAQEPGAYDYLRSEFAGEGDLWWIDAQTTQRGIYAGPEGRLPPMSDEWAEDHAEDHGALGAFFHRNTQDVRGTGDDYDGVKMGDSYTVFYLIDKADDDDPTAESWGGEYRKAGDRYWVDRTDEDFAWSGSDGARTTYEDRAAWTGDFAKRFDWLRTPAPDDDDDNPPGLADPVLTRRGTLDGSPEKDQTLKGSKSANTVFIDAAADSGVDRIEDFASNDVLAVNRALRVDDGVVRVVDGSVLIDGSSGDDRLRLGDVDGLRALGQSELGLWIYADAGVRPEGAVEGALGDDRLSGDAGDRRADRFFFDTALDLDLGTDWIVDFGRRDKIVTTSRLFDGNGDGKLTFGSNDGLDLRSGDDGRSVGHVRISDPGGDAVTHLELERSIIQDGVAYFIYGLLD